jgi:hypothetical protein
MKSANNTGRSAKETEILPGLRTAFVAAADDLVSLAALGGEAT